MKWEICIVITIVLVSMLFSGCQTTKRKPIAVLDVYIEENGFFTITERKTGEGIAVRFNVAEVYRKELND